jgi:hypothetical protein
MGKLSGRVLVTCLKLQSKQPNIQTINQQQQSSVFVLLNCLNLVTRTPWRIMSADTKFELQINLEPFHTQAQHSQQAHAITQKFGISRYALNI